MSLLRPSEGFPQRADPAPSYVGTRLSLSLRWVAVSNVFSAITIARKRVFGLSSPHYSLRFTVLGMLGLALYSNERSEVSGTG